MSTSPPDHQPRAGRRPEDDAMDTFTVSLPHRTFVRLFGGNPLIRGSDLVARTALDRWRHAAWQRDFDNLV
jgi:hypothetical protein